ncbi:hypothetical protein LV78_001127 [Actinosynnema pretiosum]|nr:VOC family protein [Actinosynnema pretiosum]MCP2093187.1 hypothetical protein [Actinosynnema pretiosum]
MNSAVPAPPAPSTSPPDESVLDVEGLELLFGVGVDAKVEKNRVHLDVNSRSAEHQAELVDRALALGAARADIGQRDVPWVVLTDPEGNEFCVLDPRDGYATAGPLAAVVCDAHTPTTQARFWSAATGLEVFRTHEKFASLKPERGPWLEFVRTDDRKRSKLRVHLDVAPGVDDATGSEVDRLLALGAAHVDIGQRDVPWVVLTDPEGNEFCVLTPR